jgi:hypothetical protein
MNHNTMQAYQQTQAVADYQPDMQAPYATHTANMLMNPQIMQALDSFANMMAGGVATVPQHLRKNKADCMAVVMQAAQWGMNPFAVAQKTHLTQGGQLGYEAQLVNAVITSNGPFDGRPDYEFFGDWDKILGKVQERKSDKGGKYYVAGWNASDEAGLGVIVRARLRGEEEARELKLLMTQCYPRFSTQWATDPQQQISYAALKKFARRYCPDVILGVYTPDEFEPVDPPPEREINPVDTGTQASSLKNRVKKTRAPIDAEPAPVQQPAPEPQQSMPDFGEQQSPARDYSSAIQTMIDGIKECSSAEELSQWGKDIGEFAEDHPEVDLIEVKRAYQAKKNALTGEHA